MMDDWATNGIYSHLGQSNVVYGWEGRLELAHRKPGRQEKVDADELPTLWWEMKALRWNHRLIAC